MSWKVTPQSIVKSLSHLMPGRAKSDGDKEGTPSGRTVKAVDSTGTQGLKKNDAFVKMHRMELTERGAKSFLGKALIKMGVAKQEEIPEPVPEQPKSEADIEGEKFKAEVAEKFEMDIASKPEGAGEFGSVSSAVSAQHGRNHAEPVKAIKTTFNKSGSIEIEIQERLAGHENIAVLSRSHRKFTVLPSENGPAATGYAEALEMEFVPQSLKDVISPSRKLSDVKTAGKVPEALRQLGSSGAEPLPSGLLKKISRGIAEGLHAMHVMNPPVGHFDLHPGNILVDGGGTAKITDFGCAKEFLPDGRVNGSGVINIKYNGPEFWDSSHRFSTKADMWGLGCVIFEAATGQSVCSDLIGVVPQNKRAEAITAFGRKALQHEIFYKPENAKLKDLLSHLLEPNPAKRYSVQQALAHPYFAS